MRFVVIGLIMALALVGCSNEDEGFCDAARAFNELDSTSESGLEDAQDAFRDLANEAPDEIKAEAELIADAIEEAGSGDVSAVADPSFQEAVDKVQTYGEENCSGLE